MFVYSVLSQFYQEISRQLDHVPNFTTSQLIFHGVASFCIFEICNLWIDSFSLNWWLSSVLHPRQHSIGYMGDSFYRSKDPTNSIKVLKEMLQRTNQTTKTTKYTYADNNIHKKDIHKISTTSPLVCTNMGWLGDGSHRWQVRQAWTAHTNAEFNWLFRANGCRVVCSWLVVRVRGCDQATTQRHLGAVAWSNLISSVAGRHLTVRLRCAPTPVSHASSSQISHDVTTTDMHEVS